MLLCLASNALVSFVGCFDEANFGGGAEKGCLIPRGRLTAGEAPAYLLLSDMRTPDKAAKLVKLLGKQKIAK